MKFDDPIAMLMTGWVPLASMMTGSGRTHKLVKVNDNRLEFRETFLIRLLRKLIGPMFIWGGSVVLIDHLHPTRIGITFVLALLSIFLGLFFFTTASVSTPIVFDKDIGFFWRSKKVPTKLYVSDKKEIGEKEIGELAQFLEQFDSSINHLPASSSFDKASTDSAETQWNCRREIQSYSDVTAPFAPLEDIRALQLLIVQRKSSEDNSDWYVYQLNLVLRSGKRLNVVEYGSQVGLRQDTEILSAFLEKPIWDATPD